MAQANTAHSPASKGTVPAKVLLVDDDKAVRFSLSEILEHHGFNVSSPANVPDVLRLINSEAFDVLLNDVHMYSGRT
ncbi:MAG TPA: response regulator [Acidobacteriaceae bacterium]|jgi:DNA-binding NtrC family response regulator|nr:response regulator [Acidobacteriaceae bacterium]